MIVHAEIEVLRRRLVHLEQEMLAQGSAVLALDRRLTQAEADAASQRKPLAKCGSRKLLAATVNMQVRP